MQDSDGGGSGGGPASAGGGVSCGGSARGSSGAAEAARSGHAATSAPPGGRPAVRVADRPPGRACLPGASAPLTSKFIHFVSIVFSTLHRP